MPLIESAYILSFSPLSDIRSKGDSLRIAVDIAVLTAQGPLNDNIYECERRMELSGQKNVKRNVRYARQVEEHP